MPIGNPIQKNNDTRVISATATTGQTDFTVTGGYTINAIGVFRNGVRLNNSTDFTAADGSTVSLNVACDAGDTVTFHIFDEFTVANAIVGAASTQTVYGNLAVNGELYSTNLNPTNVDIVGIATIAKAIIGTGVTIDQSNIDTVGLISATTFTGNLTGDVTGTTSLVTAVNNASDSTCFPLFATQATGNVAPSSNANLTFNSSTGAFSATSVAGNIVGGTVSGTTGTFTGDVDIADKIVHTGDTNTAIRFPAADTITAETAGSERLRVASTGDLGLNVTPANWDTTFKALEGGGTSKHGALHFQANGDWTTSLGCNNYYNSGWKYRHAGGASWFEMKEDTFKFSIASSGSADGAITWSEKLRIEADGSVGIGTDDASWGLSGAGGLVVGSGTGAQAITIFSGSSNTGDLSFGDATSGTARYSGLIRYDHATDFMAFRTGTVERLRITSAGKVLIGATAARVESNGLASPLQIEGTGLSSCSVIIARNSNNQASSQLIFQKSRGTSVGSNTVIQSGDAVGTITFEGSDGTNTDSLASIIGACDGTPGTNDVPGRLVFSTTADGAASPTERMRIDSSGNLGINATNPNAKLVVAGASPYTLTDSGRAVEGIDITGTAGGNGNYGAAISFGAGATGRAAIAAVQNATDADNVGFAIITHPTGTGANDGVEKVRIKSDGKVGLGTDSPAVLLDIVDGKVANSDRNTDDKLTIESNGTTNINLISANDNSGFLLFSDDVRAKGYVKYDHSQGWLEFKADGTACVRMQADNLNVLDGNVVIGTAGHGIDFSANSHASGMTSELLDDYEEGTWTPAIETAGSPTTNNANGMYTKIGQLVTCSFYMNISSATFSNSTRISGLPFPYNASVESPISISRLGQAYNAAESAGSRPCKAIGHTSINASWIYVDVLTSGTSSTPKGTFTYRIA